MFLSRYVLSCALDNAHRLQGYTWGRPIDSLLNVVEDPSSGFDLIILSDLIFNHSQVRRPRHYNGNI
jgi:hypothetical protein